MRERIMRRRSVLLSVSAVLIGALVGAPVAAGRAKKVRASASGTVIGAAAAAAAAA